MRLLVLSDSHMRTENTERAIEGVYKHIDAIIHLGDCVDDILKLNITDKKIFYVSGNCDYWITEPETQLIELENARIFMAHGHNHAVKRGSEVILSAARENRANVCLFGHTHRPECFYEGGILMLNPGSITLPRGGHPPSYGILSIIEAGIDGAVCDLLRH